MAASEEEKEDILSERALHTFGRADFLGDFAEKARRDTFHPQDNPNGIINMGTSVNRLMEKEIKSRLEQSDCLRFDKKLQHYHDLYGTPPLRSAVANFLQRHLCPDRVIDPSNVVVMSGVAACLDALGHSLCDPGDVFIAPTPVYARIFNNLSERSRVNVMPLKTTQEMTSGGKPFTFQPADLENRIKELLDEGKKVKGIVLVHPHNPFGDFYSREFLQQILEVCARYKLHVVVDEIYAFSIFRNQEKFSSILTFSKGVNVERLHFVWGMTKDFGLAGFRVGVIHTMNKNVVACLKKLSTFMCTSTVMQHVTATLLSDKEWCDNFYMPTNRKKLLENNQLVSQRLRDMGFRVRESDAALFVWVDAQEFMTEKTREAEVELFKAVFDNGVYIIPGCQMHCDDPGWFRILFSLDPQNLECGLAKIQAVVEKRRK